MEWYCALCHYLLDKNYVETRDENEFIESIQQQLEQKVAQLYKAILFYQMKSICNYYKHQGFVFLQDLSNWNDWDGYLKSVKDAEDTLKKDSAQFHGEHVKMALGKLVEVTKTCESQLQDIHRDIHQAIQDQTDQQENRYKDEKSRKYLEDLFVAHPEFDMRRIERKKGGLLNDVFKWILDEPQYKALINWSHDESDCSQSQLLWVKGLAGMGKTMLVIGIIRELSDQLVDFAPNLSYFFCEGIDDLAQNSATAILRSLVSMLLAQQPDLVKHLQLEHERMYNDSLFSDKKYAWDAVSRVFENMLKDVGPVYFIVDALDECDEGLEDLISLISTSLKRSKRVKWLVSSRSNIDVLGQLQRQGIKDLDDIKNVLDLDTQDLKEIVNAYTQHKLSSLVGRAGYDKNTLTKVSDEIRQRAGKTFLWVALVFEVLDEKDEDLNPVDGCSALKIVKEIPPGLSELYDHMMTRIEKKKRSIPRDCRNVLAVTALARRPLSFRELAVVAGLQEPQNIVKYCGSFLRPDKDTVSLIHQSAKDYLLEDLEGSEEPPPSRLHSSSAQVHRHIIDRSIYAMSKLQRDIYELQQYGFQTKDIPPPERDPLAPLGYSCLFWLDHLRDAIKAISEKSGESVKQSEALYKSGFEFLKTHFLHWLESLSLLHKYSDGIISLRELIKIIPVMILVTI